MLTISDIRKIRRDGRHQRLRKHISGTPQRLRLCVYRSLGNLYAQVVNDVEGKVLFGISTLNKDIKAKIKSGGNVEAASVLGAAMAHLAKSNGVTRVCFDRGGYHYHGRIKAFAQAARSGGLEF